MDLAVRRPHPESDPVVMARNAYRDGLRLSQDILEASSAPENGSGVTLAQDLPVEPRASQIR